MKIYLIEAALNTPRADITALRTALSQIQGLELVGRREQANVAVALLLPDSTGGVMDVLTNLQEQRPVWCFYVHGTVLNGNLRDCESGAIATLDPSLLTILSYQTIDDVVNLVRTCVDLSRIEQEALRTAC